MFEWVTNLIAQFGYAGVAFLMFLENLVPPVPSELIMPLAGFVASQGELAHWAVLTAGTAGSFAGALFWFIVGRRIGEERLRKFVDRHGKWVTLSCEDLDQANEWFRRHGAASVFIGRLIPGVRTFISVPAGISSMPLPKFVVYTVAGTLVWTAVLMFAGHVLRENYELVSDYIGVISNAVLVLFAAGLAWRYFRQWRQRLAESTS
jgi:membrane protein DedA with SNARE-associated domain